MFANDPMFDSAFSKLGIAGGLLAVLWLAIKEFFAWLGKKPVESHTEDSVDKKLDSLLLDVRATNTLLRDFLSQRTEQWKFMYEAICSIRSEDIEMIRSRLHDVMNALAMIQGDAQLNRDQRKQVVDLLSKVEQYLSRRFK